MSLVALVIGGSSGIGYATIRSLLIAGYRVYNASRRPCPDLRVKSFIVDVIYPEQIEDAIAAILSEQSRIDVLLYCAGCSLAAPIEAINRSDYLYLFAVNFLGVIEAIRLVIPCMRTSGGGRIIVISSIGSVAPIPYDSFYTSSKAALNSLVQSLALELSPLRIHITSVLPGGIRNDFTKKRKVYPVAHNPHYADFLRASRTLAILEQTGANDERVAKTIMGLLNRPHPPLIKAVGFPYQLIHFLTRIIPYRWTNALVRFVFHMDSSSRSE